MGENPQTLTVKEVGMAQKMIMITLFLILPLAQIALFDPCSSHAADWNFYGSARVQTFILDEDYGDMGLANTKNYDQYLQGNSRIGARVTVSDRLTGRFEYGTGVNLRILYGEWDFGPGTLLVGQTYSPLNMIYSSQVWWDDTSLLDFGGLYSGRNPMIRLKFGDFQIALLQPATPGISALTSTEANLPKIEAKYRFSGTHGFLEIAGGYNSYEIINGSTSYDIDSYIVALGGSLTFGWIFLKASAWKGRNTGSYQIMNMPMDLPAIDLGTHTVNDNDAYAYILVAGVKVNETVAVEAGYGYTEAELDVVNSQEEGITSLYFQTRLTLAPGVSVVPEIGLIDWEKNAAGVDQGETLYYGAKWQIDF